MNGSAQWYFRREGAIQDETVGPVNEDEMAELIRTKKIKPATFVLSPQVTTGQWVQLSGVDFKGALAKYDARVEQQRLREEQQRLREEEARKKLEAGRREEAARAEHQAQAQQARALQEAEQRRMQENMERTRYLRSVSAHRRRYKVVVSNPGESERICNQMGFEGWDLEQAFAETFSHQPCCSQPVHERKFVLVFSQPLDLPAA